MAQYFDAVFLDRDGVIIHNRANYVRQWQDVRIYPKSLLALRYLVQRIPESKIILITNQSAIGRGLTTRGNVDEINERLKKTIAAAGGRIDGIFLCPHSPQENCDCRKPQPGLLYRAAHDLHISLSRSVMIGDAITDLEAGLRAGIPRLILVKTGRGKQQLGQLNGSPLMSMITVEPNLYVAVKHLG
ncbi:MAG: HAD family hydrolase [Bellilinea sp.]